MLRRASIAGLWITLLAAASAAERPNWAFFVPTTASPQVAEAPAANSTSWTAPDSHRSYTIAELQNPLSPPDWYPGEHPAMPDIVARGIGATQDSPPLLPCALCHLPNGAGHVESASLAGLPAEYIERQFADWRGGARKIAVGNAQKAAFLTALKRRYSAAQISDAARYFAALTPRRWMQIVEAASVPSSAVNSETLMRLPLPGNQTERLGRRIVELPVDPLRLVYRDSHSGFLAYVPRGSVANGRALINESDASGLPPCSTCHGPKLTGSPAAPPIAGRLPTYIVRQLWAFHGTDRRGDTAAAMRLVAARLEPDQMLDIAAYLASLPP
jgi:cytochrome c553